MTSRPRSTQAASRRLRVLARMLLLATTALPVSGCMLSRSDETTASIPSDYRERHPIAVREGEHTLDIFVGARRGELTSAQGADVAVFAATWRRDATGGIVVELPSGTPNARAAAAMAGEIRSVLAHSGVPPRSIVIRKYQPHDPGKLATVRLVYPKMVAEAGPCGIWPNDIGPTRDTTYNQNVPYWNLGCAHQRNLAAMVANPADLVQPRGEAPVYAERRKTVLDNYRKGENTTSNAQNADKGKISDVGK
jgi:pilus assembly protein CpaD